jgi:hypothetical protein
VGRRTKVRRAHLQHRVAWGEDGLRARGVTARRSRLASRAFEHIKRGAGGVGRCMGRGRMLVVWSTRCTIWNCTFVYFVQVESVQIRYYGQCLVMYTDFLPCVFFTPRILQVREGILKVSVTLFGVRPHQNSHAPCARLISSAHSHFLPHERIPTSSDSLCISTRISRTRSSAAMRCHQLCLHTPAYNRATLVSQLIEGMERG